MFTILVLVLLALLFLVAELVLLPGITVAGLLALVCGGSAIYRAFTDFGWVTGVLVTAIVLTLALVTIVVSLRAKTWQRFALNQRVAASAGKPASQSVAVGTRGRTVSRLSPMGTVEIGGETYEAKLQSGYADPGVEVEVVGFENANVIVRIVQ